MKKENSESEETNVFNLILKLRQEKLLVRKEKTNIQELNILIRSKTHKIIQAAWITTKQRLLLYQRDPSSQNYLKVDFLLNSEFVEAKKALGFQNSIKVGNLLQVLRSQPAQLAKWLIIGEQMAEDSHNYSLVLQSIVVGLYGCFIFPEDTKFMLSLLYELAKLQLLSSDNPRRIMKQRTCSFNQLYFLFHEVLQPAKFFLSAALEIPIIQLMSCTDYYLDVDPDKTLMRYNQDDNEITNLFKDAEEYRREVINKLVLYTNSFISSLLENVYSFPKSISWIVCHISKIIEKSFGSKEANSIITELIFTLYICPVIVDPEQYGICNSQVTEIARHNLIQVGQIMQSLALNKFEPTDLKYADLFDMLDKNRVNNFIELLLFDMDNEDPPVDASPGIVRDMMLFTEQELNNVISIFQKIQTNQKQSEKFLKDDETIEEQLASLSLSRDNSPKSNRLASTEEITSKKPNFFSLGSKNHIPRSVSEEIKTHCNIVLIFPIDQTQSDPIGLLPEEKIIDLSIPVKTEEIFEAPAKIISSLPGTPIQNGDIKQSFNFQDEGSIGNTSDNLEAISEAASNHSVDSSIELENEDQNDNLSDMVSANVSGRGTPNISGSGRDTPSSQVCENDDRVMAEARQIDIAQPQQNLSRQIRSEIDDKFCKFEIKKLLEGDETISIISETWSTDVLASDNETVDAGDSRQERQSLQLQMVEPTIQEVPIGNILDISETQSESAWSTDVMASDTERLTEVDNDDTVSVAQSDDTNSVARSDDTRSETDENLSGIRRLSSSSNSYVSNVPPPHNYISTVTVSNTTNYIAASNNPFLSNGSISNMHYIPSLPSNSTNSTKSTTNYVTSSNFQEYRKVDIKNDRINGKIYHAAHTDNNANTVFRSLTLNNSEHSFCESGAEIKSSVFNSTASTVTTLVNNRVQSSVLKESDLNSVAGPSGLNKKPATLVEAENEYLKQNRNMKKYDDRPNEILLSNCSLNSSSSGSSSNSFENKNSHNENSEQWESKQWLNSSGSSLNVTLTPSESTSELSVLSVNNISNPVNILSKKSVTLLNNRILKPSVSTGAIPKSISFDMSADKGLEDDSRSKRERGFFGKFKIGFKNRRGKAFRAQDDYRLENEDFGSSKRLSDSPMKINNNTEVSDDILAKYRTKPFVESSPIKEICDVNKSPKGRNLVVSINSEEVNSFNDIKNKLRLVLSNISEIPHYVKNNPISVKNKIETVLRLELGKARKLREWSDVARISEAIRCVNLLNDSSCLKLLKSMKEDIILRSTYIQYLVTSKQELLFCDNYLDSLQIQISHDKHQCEKYLATVCVRDFLSEQETVILDFCDEFKQLSLADEKCDFLHNFYNKLYSIMNGSSLWQGIFLNRESAIKITLERFIMSKIYKNSIYPNGDGDRDRDRVLHEHIEKLSKIITPNHKDVLIHKMYLRECPWFPAQDALRALNAYKTPRDKVKCVVHCAKCIMDLLSLSQHNGSTTADDFTPVLVYVIIKVNPEALLSTVQYVNSFFHNQLFGEEEYWWTQFCAAVEYIKTMDYSD